LGRITGIANKKNTGGCRYFFGCPERKERRKRNGHPKLIGSGPKSRGERM
jgi:hypothetical protein